MDLTPWTVHSGIYDPAAADIDATVFTCANGYFATRGTHPECDDGAPGTTLAGVFANDANGFRTLVTCARWLDVGVEVDGRSWRPRDARPASVRRLYNLRHGVVARNLVWDINDRVALEVDTEHFCSLSVRRVGWQRYRVRAHGGPITLRLTAAVSGHVKTRSEHLLGQPRVTLDDGQATITAQTVDGDYAIAMHAGVWLTSNAPAECTARRGTARWVFDIELKDGQSVTLHKIVGFASDRDAGTEYVARAQTATRSARQRGYTADRKRHAAAWQRLWQDIHLEIVGDDENALALRYVTAQLVSHAPQTDDRVGLAAKPLCAEGYRGHVFWDTDLFMTPAVTALRPERGRRLMNYRWEMLDGARTNAGKWGYRGAWFPWESADDGTEVTPQYWLHPDGRKMPITCWKYEIHSVCDVAFAAWDFYRATGDQEWLFAKGAELLIETARFWASRATYNANEKRFEIHDVCGPDEAHEHTDNCAYINVLAAWNIEKAIDVLDTLRTKRPAACAALEARLQLTRSELTTLRRVGRKLYIPLDRKTGWYRQFDGFEDLQFVDPQTVSERFEEPPDAATTQAVKQADVIMLLYLLRDTHTREQVLANWDYYVPRTVHNTSLSAGTHAAVAGRLGLVKTAHRFFTQSVNTDLLNVRGDTGRGLHGAAMGGAICAVLFGFGGIEFHEDHLRVDPILPPQWQRLRLRFVYHGRRLMLDITQDGFKLRFRRADEPITVITGGRRRRLWPERVIEGKLMPPAMMVRNFT